MLLVGLGLCRSISCPVSVLPFVGLLRRRAVPRVRGPSRLDADGRGVRTACHRARGGLPDGQVRPLWRRAVATLAVGLVAGRAAAARAALRRRGQRSLNYDLGGGPG